MKRKKLVWEIESSVYLMDEIIKNYKSVDFGVLLQSIADEIGVTKASVKMAIQNITYILSDGARGLSATTKRQKHAVEFILDKNKMSSQKLLDILN